MIHGEGLNNYGVFNEITKIRETINSKEKVGLIYTSTIKTTFYLME